MKGRRVAGTARLFQAGVVIFCMIAPWPSTVRSEQDESQDRTASVADTAPREEPLSADRLSSQGQHDVPRRRVPFMRPDGTFLLLDRNKFYLDEALRPPQWLHLGLQHRDRYESYDAPFRKGETTGAQQVALQTLAQIGIRYDPIRVYAELIDARALATTGIGVTNQMEDVTDVLQLYAGLGTTRFLGLQIPTELKVGRYTMDVGHRRLIARNQFRNTINAFQGLHWTLGDEKDWQFLAFAARPVLRFQTTLDQPEASTLFWGVLLGQQRVAWLHTEAYGFVLREKEQVAGPAGIGDEQTLQGKRENLNTVGVRLFKPRALREIDYEVESDWQFGRSSLQTGSPVLPTVANYQHAEVGYTVPLPWTPHLLVEYDYASGDHNPTDHRNGRFSPLYGARNFEYGPTGIWGPFFRSNISSPGYQLTLTPNKRIYILFRHRIWWLAQSRDQWVGSGLQDPSGRAGNYLGYTLEPRIQWVLNPNVQIEAGWVYLIKGSYIERLRELGIAGVPNADNVSYTFVQTVLKF
jgi:hypothetical protein